MHVSGYTCYACVQSKKMLDLIWEFLPGMVTVAARCMIYFSDREVGMLGRIF